MSRGAVARYLPPLLAGALGAWTAIYAFEGPLRELGTGARGAGGGEGGGEAAVEATEAAAGESAAASARARPG